MASLKPKAVPQTPHVPQTQPARIEFQCETGEAWHSVLEGIVETIQSNFHSPQAEML